MVRWRAIGPISVRLEERSFSHDDFSVSRYDEDQLDELLKDDKKYWSPVNFDLAYKPGYWLELDFDVNHDEKFWEKAVSLVRSFLEACGLFKTTLSKLAVAGLCVRRPDEGGSFGWEDTIVGKRHYLLKTTEYNGFIELLDKYTKFWNANKPTAQSSKQLKRINWARYYFGKTYQAIKAVERYIFLSLALEFLYGEGQHELRYRLSNRAALLLGDDIERRRIVYGDVQKAYKKRSNILHGGISWRIEPKEVLIYTEIIRQTILRCISLHEKGYSNINKALDECMHDPEKHAKLLKDAKAFFGTLSEYKEPGKSARSRGWAIRK